MTAQERDLREQSVILAEAELRMAEDYLLFMQSGSSSYQAQRMAEAKNIVEVRTAQAEYEIALARLKRELPRP